MVIVFTLAPFGYLQCTMQEKQCYHHKPCLNQKALLIQLLPLSRLYFFPKQTLGLRGTLITIPSTEIFLNLDLFSYASLFHP